MARVVTSRLILWTAFRDAIRHATLGSPPLSHASAILCLRTSYCSRFRDVWCRCRSCPLSYVLCLMSFVSCLLSFVLCLMSFVVCPLSCVLSCDGDRLMSCVVMRNVFSCDAVRVKSP